MNAWISLPLIIIAATAFILILAGASSLIVSRCAGNHSKKTLEKNLDQLEKMLPGKNCGACGCESCAAYAEAVFTHQMDTDCCPHGTEDLSKRMDTHMENFLKSIENNTPKKESWAERHN